MSRLQQLARAFVTAVRMTLRGEQPPPSPHAALQQWMLHTVRLADTTLTAATAQGLGQAQRKAHTLAAEGRRTNMDTILVAVKFHAGTEYPHLLAQKTPTAISAIYATNVNDRFLASKLFDTLDAGAVRDAVGRLAAHLESIPPLQPE